MEKCKKSTNMSAPAAGRLSGRKTTPFTPLRAAEKMRNYLPPSTSMCYNKKKEL